MPERLLENDFWTVNLSSIITNQKVDKTVTSSEPASDAKNAKSNLQKTNTEKSEPQKTDVNNAADLSKITDWGKELEKRNNDNKSLSKEAQKSKYEIESNFFKDFFDATWKDPEMTKLLMSIGDPLKKALKILGFNPKINPILGFLCNNYVQKSLLKTGLLNANTFKAIYNAVANKWVADSEFLVSNTYNIIYCPKLYTKTRSEIEGYLKLQNRFLKPSAKSYTAEEQELNRKIFIKLSKIKEVDPDKIIEKIKAGGEILKAPSVKSSSAELNTLELAEILLKRLGNVSSTEKDEQEPVALSSENQSEIINKLNTSAQIFAMLLALSLNNNSSEITKVLESDIFKGLSTAEIAAAASWIKKENILQNSKLTGKSINELVSALRAKLQKVA